MPLGLYISVPFCKQKCSFCNFASGVFSHDKIQAYVDRLCDDMDHAGEIALRNRGRSERCADTIYLGGGTPTVLAPEQLKRIFAAARRNFDLAANVEITIECAPGTLGDKMLDSMLECGVNRVSLGVQSFVESESRAVGRTHTSAIIFSEIETLRREGISNISIDLIAGLPRQTRGSWERSLREVIASGVPHVSVYLLEVDDESRLGRELLAGGKRYHAHGVPNDDLAADLYQAAGHRLADAGVMQYEISNFARSGYQSKHNLKYWTRQPYFGFGLDASSMLPADPAHLPALATRFCTPSDLDEYMTWDRGATHELISPIAALEEELFLGLRLNRGIDFNGVLSRSRTHGVDVNGTVLDLLEAGLVELESGILRLTAKGRLLSNAVFARFVSLRSEVIAVSGSRDDEITHIGLPGGG